MSRSRETRGKVRFGKGPQSQPKLVFMGKKLWHVLQPSSFCFHKCIFTTPIALPVSSMLCFCLSTRDGTAHCMRDLSRWLSAMTSTGSGNTTHECAQLSDKQRSLFPGVRNLSQIDQKVNVA